MNREQRRKAKNNPAGVAEETAAVIPAMEIPPASDPTIELVTEEASSPDAADFATETAVEVAEVVEVAAEPTAESTVEVAVESMTEAPVEVVAEPTVEAPVEVAAEPTVEAPVEVAAEVAAEPTAEAAEVSPAPIETKESILAEIERLRANIAAATGTTRKAAGSGSRPRPNVVYTLLKKPLAWASTPQVAQLQQILFSPEVAAKFGKLDGTVQMAEPELFAVIVAGAEAGILRTSQPPVRIWQYYKSDLLNADCIRWK
jgi:hypothetical protein